MKKKFHLKFDVTKLPILLSEKTTKRGEGSKIADFETSLFEDRDQNVGLIEVKVIIYYSLCK